MNTTHESKTQTQSHDTRVISRLCLELGEADRWRQNGWTIKSGGSRAELHR